MEPALHPMAAGLHLRLPAPTTPRRNSSIDRRRIDTLAIAH
jgi:hypothetical protein